MLVDQCVPVQFLQEEDLVAIITKKHLDRNESLKMTAIMREIMEIHYLGLVGLYSLSDEFHTCSSYVDVSGMTSVLCTPNYCE